jgi:GATA-binding protein
VNPRARGTDLRNLGNSVSPRSQNHILLHTQQRSTKTGPMTHPPGSGGTSLAPTPTHPHHLSRETSKDELEMAESLRLLNQAHEHHRPRTETPAQEQHQTHSQEDQRHEIYHSLEDAVPISEQPANSANSTSLQLPNMSYDASNAPVAGQVCRCVI